VSDPERPPTIVSPDGALPDPEAVPDGTYVVDLTRGAGWALVRQEPATLPDAFGVEQPNPFWGPHDAPPWQRCHAARVVPVAELPAAMADAAAVPLGDVLASDDGAHAYQRQGGAGEEHWRCILSYERTTPETVAARLAAAAAPAAAPAPRAARRRMRR
jgi:hypothetical protein